MNTVCRLSGIWLVIGLVVCNASSANDSPRETCASNVLVDWNARVLEMAVAEDGLLTLKGVRTTAMMHIAVHDAINSIRRHYTHYAFRADGLGADPVETAAQAAYEVAVSQYPGQETQLRRELRKWIAQVGDPDKARRSIELGREAARAILERRATDRWNAEGEYQWQPAGPGVYAEFPEHSGTPSGFVFGIGWGTAEPFMLQRPDQFRVAPPPEVSGEIYARAYQEVKEVGRFESRARSADQTHQALWWKDFAENSHNRLARTLVAKRGTDLWTAARLFALLNMSIFDGYIATFDAKFAYNHWRPYTAIRSADQDGNPRTRAEPNWTNLHRHTYAFPSYPSAHGTVCGAGMAVLADTFGGDTRFTMTTREVNAGGPLSPLLKLRPSTRRFENFAAAAMECALSRVYLGIHFRYDAVAGNALGEDVGHYAVERYLVSAP